MGNLSTVEVGNLWEEMIVIIDTNRRSGRESAIRCEDHNRPLTRKFHIHNGASPRARTEAAHSLNSQIAIDVHRGPAAVPKSKLKYRYKLRLYKN